MALNKKETAKPLSKPSKKTEVAAKKSEREERGKADSAATQQTTTRPARRRPCPKPSSAAQCDRRARSVADTTTALPPSARIAVEVSSASKLLSPLQSFQPTTIPPDLTLPLPSTAVAPGPPAASSPRLLVSRPSLPVAVASPRHGRPSHQRRGGDRRDPGQEPGRMRYKRVGFSCWVSISRLGRVYV
ncbi:hypothetical protein BT93_G0263 [Corymbia citriodora subsp. variegata]|nr:hypothetical protein BT93_G0263 [Corymbia citriodora subsp. variegata]